LAPARHIAITNKGNNKECQNGYLFWGIGGGGFLADTAENKRSRCTSVRQRCLMSDNKTVEQQKNGSFQQLPAQPVLSALPSRQNIELALKQAAKTQLYQNELQQQRLRNLAAELNAISDPTEKMQFIENRLLENLQHLKRQLAILQQGIPGASAGIAGDKED
jgi:hypothetical protein